MSRIVAVRTETRCKVCASARREAIDGYLLKRHVGEEVEGQPVTLKWISERSELIAGEKLSHTGLKRHLARGHSRFMNDEDTADQADELNEASDAERRRLVEQLTNGAASEEDVLHFVVQQWAREAGVKLLAGETLQITTDQLIRATEALNRRRSDRAQSELLRALGGGIARAFEGTLSPKKPQGELIEGEIVEEGEVE